MTIDEKRQLGAMIEKLNRTKLDDLGGSRYGILTLCAADQLEQVMDIMNVKENEVEVDIMDLDQTTLRKLRVRNSLKLVLPCSNADNICLGVR